MSSSQLLFTPSFFRGVNGPPTSQLRPQVVHAQKPLGGHLMNWGYNLLQPMTEGVSSPPIWVCLKMWLVPHCSQWFCWSWNPVLKWLAIIGNINPTFSDKPICQGLRHFLVYSQWLCEFPANQSRRGVTSDGVKGFLYPKAELFGLVNSFFICPDGVRFL